VLGAATFGQNDMAGRVAEAAADTRALRQLSVLILCGLACTMFVVVFLVLAALQAVAIIDEASRGREMAQVIRYIDAVPGGMNEITLDAMTRTLGLIDARLTQASDVRPEELSASLVMGSDRVIAWTPQLIGTRTFGLVAPVRIVAGVVFTLIVAVIGWRVVVVSNRLDKRRAVATRLAHTDTLTGLGNRRAFDQGLETRLDKAAETGRGLVLVLLDLDDFKQINDALGHSAGDAVLQIVARHLRETAAQDDLVVRLGGDEFAVVREGATGLDDYLAALDARFEQPIAIGGRHLRVGASIGMARSEDFPGQPTRLIQAADIALYRAKRNGPGNAELAIPPVSGRHAA
jgi:diguanylate cyclase (GGDEF)-like protein